MTNFEEECAFIGTDACEEIYDSQVENMGDKIREFYGEE